MKKIIVLIIILFSIYNNGFSCAVCLGDFTQNEIVAYSFSVLFMISVLFVLIYILFKKILKNYDIY